MGGRSGRSRFRGLPPGIKVLRRLAGYYDQMSEDSGEGNRVGPFKGRGTEAGRRARGQNGLT
jgi:hypothetical protein